MVGVGVGGQTVGGNLPLSPPRLLGSAVPACGRASDAAPLRLRFGLPGGPTHPPLSTAEGKPRWSESASGGKQWVETFRFPPPASSAAPSRPAAGQATLPPFA